MNVRLKYLCERMFVSQRYHYRMFAMLCKFFFKNPAEPHDLHIEESSGETGRESLAITMLFSTKVYAKVDSFSSTWILICVCALVK